MYRRLRRADVRGVISKALRVWGRGRGGFTSASRHSASGDAPGLRLARIATAFPSARASSRARCAQASCWHAIPARMGRPAATRPRSKPRRTPSRCGASPAWPPPVPTPESRRQRPPLRAAAGAWRPPFLSSSRYLGEFLKPTAAGARVGAMAAARGSPQPSGWDPDGCSTLALHIIDNWSNTARTNKLDRVSAHAATCQMSTVQSSQGPRARHAGAGCEYGVQRCCRRRPASRDSR